MPADRVEATLSPRARAHRLTLPRPEAPRSRCRQKRRMPVIMARSGELAQLVERCNRTAEVRGSSPLFSMSPHASPGRKGAGSADHRARNRSGGPVQRVETRQSWRPLPEAQEQPTDRASSAQRLREVRRQAHRLARLASRGPDPRSEPGSQENPAWGRLSGMSELERLSLNWPRLNGP